VVQSMYKGVLEGQASAGSFLEVLAASPQEAVKVGSRDQAQCFLSALKGSGSQGKLSREVVASI